MLPTCLRMRIILWASISFIRLRGNCRGGTWVLCGCLCSVCGWDGAEMGSIAVGDGQMGEWVGIELMLISSYDWSRHKTSTHTHLCTHLHDCKSHTWPAPCSVARHASLCCSHSRATRECVLWKSFRQILKRIWAHLSSCSSLLYQGWKWMLIYLMLCETSCLLQTAICLVGVAEQRGIGRQSHNTGEEWNGSPLYLGRQRSRNASCAHKHECRMKGEGATPEDNIAVIHKGCSGSDAAESKSPSGWQRFPILYPYFSHQLVQFTSGEQPSLTVRSYAVRAEENLYETESKASEDWDFPRKSRRCIHIRSSPQHFIQAREENLESHFLNKQLTRAL